MYAKTIKSILHTIPLQPKHASSGQTSSQRHGNHYEEEGICYSPLTLVLVILGAICFTPTGWMARYYYIRVQLSCKNIIQHNIMSIDFKFMIINMAIIYIGRHNQRPAGVCDRYHCGVYYNCSCGCYSGAVRHWKDRMMYMIYA